MCTRFHLTEEHYRRLLRELGIDAPGACISRYNIAPGSAIPAVRNSPGRSGREVAMLRWGLTPAWARADEPAARLVNARAETLAAKPSFREAARVRRCAIPASGFYEWQSAGRSKKPWLFRRRDGQPFCLAGLWESWRASDGTVLESCAVITTEPNELMQPLHHRMPAMLAPEQFAPWLDPHVTTAEELAPLLRPPSASAMSATALDGYVSNIRHEGPACLAPAGTAPDRSGPQLALDLP